MGEKLYHQKGFYQTLLVSVLIFIMSLIVDQRQDLFVPATGKFRVFGFIWIILSIGLVLRWKYAYRILAFLTLFVIVILAPIPFFVEKEFLFAHLAIFASLAFIIYMLFFSKPLKEYVNRK